MFYTAANNKAANSRLGLGLGLALCKSVVEAHHGYFEITDNKPCGTIFSFVINPLRRTKMNKGTVLVIEDDKAIQNLIGTTLEIFDYNYLISSNAKDGILKITSYNPDIVILDLGLPDIDGIEVIKKVRSFSLVPIIVVSARIDNQDKITALDMGADDFLTKPFNTEELLARVRVAIRHKQQNLRKKLNASDYIITHIGIGCRMLNIS